MEVIFCFGGNRVYAEIAIASGMLYGIRSGYTPYFPVHFIDQDWKKPNRGKYMNLLSVHCPKVATVLDLEQREQLEEVLDWAEEAAAFCETVIVIPKVSGVMGEIPSVIGGKEVRLGYSVPTRYGKTDISTKEFEDRPVHLLGGSPHAQLKLANEMNVRSVDGNYSQKIAQNFCKYWEGGKWVPMAGEHKGKKNMIKAFGISCDNIMAAWVGK